MADAKEMWEAIKSRFSGNDESKKMQKYLLKQQFKGFSVSSSKGLYKGYDRFQTLSSQLEIHGVGVSHEDANQKFLRVFEHDVKGTTASSSSNTQNVAFVSADNTSSINDINDDGLEEMDLKCRRRDGGYNGNKTRENSRRPASQDDSKALVTIDREVVNWSGHVEEDTQNFVMMAYSSSKSGSDNK
nr:ribonuclease H-like domain-containing protein [Tanacetum cinerariifolium]